MTVFEIVTPRLILRRANLADAPVVHAAKEAVWHDLQMWMSWAHEDNKSLQSMEEKIGNMPPDSLSLIWAFRRDNGKFAVSTGLAADEDEPGTYITGYWCAQDQLGLGFATEATNAAIRYAFGALAAKAVTISYYEGNEKSANIVGKLGFTPTHTLSKKHKRCLDGVPMDEFHFRRESAIGLPSLDVSWT